MLMDQDCGPIISRTSYIRANQLKYNSDGNKRIANNLNKTIEEKLDSECHTEVNQKIRTLKISSMRAVNNKKSSMKNGYNATIDDLHFPTNPTPANYD